MEAASSDQPQRRQFDLERGGDVALGHATPDVGRCVPTRQVAPSLVRPARTGFDLDELGRQQDGTTAAPDFLEDEPQQLYWRTDIVQMTRYYMIEAAHSGIQLSPRRAGFPV